MKKSIDELVNVNYQVQTKRIDFRIIPIVCLMNMFAILDRVVLSYARNFGLEEKLNITEFQFSLLLSLFYIPYSLIQLFSNLILNNFKPSKFLSFIIIIWGIITVLTIFCTNFASLLSLRMLLGIFEAGMYPGLLFYMSNWYTKSQLATRISFLSTSGFVANSLSGVLSYFIQKITWGLENWQWLFIIEGAPSIIIGIIAYFYLPDSLDVKWLSPLEKQDLKEKLNNDCLDKDKKFNKDQFFKALMDYKILLFMFLILGTTIPINSISLLLPNIIQEIGFDQVLLLSSPPYIVTSIVSILWAKHSDHKKERGNHIIVALLLSILSFIMLIINISPTLNYIFISLVLVFLNSTTPLIYSWNSNNQKGCTKIAMAISMVVATGNLSGIIAGQLFKKVGFLNFARSNLFCLCCLVISLLAALSLKLIFSKLIKKDPSYIL